MEHFRAGKVRQKHTESNRKEEHRLKLLDNGKVSQHERNGDHDQHFPVLSVSEEIETGLLQKIYYSTHG